MKVFHCSDCSQVVFFENTRCLNCEQQLGFDPEQLRMVRLEGRRPCRNYWQEEVCNWLVADAHELCRGCRLNRTIPNLSQSQNRQRWYRLEAAKKRLLYTVLSLQLPLEGLSFDFLVPDSEPVLTGHCDGLITLNAAEADDPVREQVRIDMAEPYRSLLGHFRHESGHFYWDRLIANSPRLPEFRQLFGDERQDYAACLKRHYEHGPRPDWQAAGFISAYASVHPWEDWAECWAHYLHIYDTLETAQAFGLAVGQEGPVRLQTRSCPEMLAHWHRLTFGLNSINRSMGISDLYPFVLAPSVQEKLGFVHRLLAGRSGQALARPA